MAGVSTMDTAERVRDFAGKYELTYLQLLDPGAAFFSTLSETSVIPRTLLVDGEGRVVMTEVGYTEQQLGGIIERLRSLLGSEAGS